MFKNKWRMAIVVGMLSSTLGFLGLYPRPAWAIKIIDNATCQKSNDYFKVWATNYVICFADPGTINFIPGLPNVVRITSGNNYGFVYETNGKYHPLCRKYSTYSFPIPTVGTIRTVQLQAQPPATCG